MAKRTATIVGPVGKSALYERRIPANDESNEAATQMARSIMIPRPMTRDRTGGNSKKAKVRSTPATRMEAATAIPMVR